VVEAAGAGGTLVDLYCGTGALGLACAARFDRVVGIDVNAASIADARQNAADNGVAAEFFAGEVERRVQELAIGERPVVIVDPPRVGLHPDALAFVAGLDARVLVYVACRPSSLLRDGLALLAAGWRCTDRWAVDLFPQTGHVEVVSRWVRA
jgi:23S rRNA (uracil1939-C5)-methyltransferase